MGLKESSSRGTKRRRETDTAAPEENAVAPTAPSSTAPPNVTTATTNLSTSTTSTPAASPSLTNTQGPAHSSAPPASPSKSTLPWPMPTVAVNTPSPVITTSSTVDAEHQPTGYYQPKTPTASSSSSKPTSRPAGTAHPYMFQPNGSRNEG
jgi:hypothetical protein